MSASDGEQLYDSSYRGELARVKVLCGKPGINVNWRKEPHGLTPLYVACQAGQAEVLRLLLSVYGLQPNLASKTGVTPFSKACTEGHASMLSMLMDDPRIDLNQPQNTGSTPFFMACQNGFPKVVEILLKDGRVDVNRARNDGTSPFYKACEKCHKEVVALILKSGIQVDVNRAQSTGVTPFYLACERGQLELVKVLLDEPRVDINRPKEDGATPLFVTAQNGHLAVAEWLLASGRNIDIQRRATFNNNTAADQGRAMAIRVKKPEEQEEDHMRKKIYGPLVADLITRFENDPEKVRNELRKGLKLPVTVGPQSVKPESPSILSPPTAKEQPPSQDPSPDVTPKSDVANTDPAKASSGATSRIALIEFNGEKTKLKITSSSLAELISSLQQHLHVTDHQLAVSVWDTDFDDYITVRDMSELSDKPRLRIAIQTSSFWVWMVDPKSWRTGGFETTRYHSLVVKEGHAIFHQGAMEKFALIANNLGFDVSLVKKVLAVSNPTLLSMFEGYRSTLHGKHRANPALFKKEDWIDQKPADTRSSYLTWLKQQSEKFSWNDGTGSRVVPMIQGTSENAVWQICQQGFGMVGSTDMGYYGRGLYFTSNLKYALNYATPGPQGKPILVCMVAPGNSFPVTEHPFLRSGEKNPGGYLGEACRGGYQSHYTVVDRREIDKAFPIRGKIDPAIAADELVVFESAQALPLFVIYV